jgi:hypothetical protein
MRYPDKIEVRFQIGDAVHWRLPNGAVLNQLEGIVVAINGDAVCVRWNDAREISYGPISRGEPALSCVRRRQTISAR